MAWCQSGDKPLLEPMMVSLLMHICLTRPQWVDSLLPVWCQATSWTRADSYPVGLPGTHINLISIKLQQFWFKELHFGDIIYKFLVIFFLVPVLLNHCSLTWQINWWIVITTGSAIAWTIVDLLSVGCLRTNVSGILINIQQFSCKKMNLKCCHQNGDYLSQHKCVKMNLINSIWGFELIMEISHHSFLL